MKGLHKKIGVGVLVSGLLIGGVSFSSGSVSYAGSKGNESSLISEIISVFAQLGILLPGELEAYSEGGFIGLLEYYYSKSSLPSVLNKISNRNERGDLNSIVQLGKYGKYSVIGLKSEGNSYSILPEYRKYWDSEKPIKIELDKFFKYARDRFDEKGKDKFKELGLNSGYIYRVLFDNKYEFGCVK